jgi:hypothetical protein
MWLSNSKKYAIDRFLEERARSGIVHEVVGYGKWPIGVGGDFRGEN